MSVVDAEARIRAEHEAGNLTEAASLALGTYGPELLGYLVAVLRDRQRAGDVFSDLSEMMWSALPRFEWRSSMRTWLYVLARRAIARHLRTGKRQPGGKPISQVTEIADRVRTQTLPHLRTEVKDRFAEIRAELATEDQMLLVLRIDRELSWKDIARVFADDDVDDATLARESARLRKRFQLLKDDLRQRAVAAGLIEVG